MLLVLICREPEATASSFAGCAGLHRLASLEWTDYDDQGGWATAMTEHVSSAAPAATPDVHVTGRRILATIVDSVVIGILFVVMSALFGRSSAAGGEASASLEGLPALIFFLLVVLYYIVLEGYLGQTPWGRCFSA